MDRGVRKFECGQFREFEKTTAVARSGLFGNGRFSVHIKMEASATTQRGDTKTRRGDDTDELVAVVCSIILTERGGILCDGDHGKARQRPQGKCVSEHDHVCSKVSSLY
jgi:hypothetical protein